MFVAAARRGVSGVAGSRRPVLRLRGLEPHPRQEPPMTDKAISPLRRATDRRHDDPPAWPWDSAPLYPPRQKLCGFRRPLARQGHPGGCPSLSAAAGVDRNHGADPQRRCLCIALLLQGHAETPRSCRGGRVGPRAAAPPIVLSAEEVSRLLASTTNIKHK